MYLLLLNIGILINKASATNKQWTALNMRKPGGLSILELQKIAQKGYLIEPTV